MKFTNPKFIAIGIALLVIVIVVIATVTASSKPPTASPSPSPTGLTFANTDVLLQNGLTVEQLEDLKFALYNYYKNFDYKVTTITFGSVSTVHDKDSADASDIMSLTIGFNDKITYGAKLNFSSLRQIQLTLVDKTTGQPIYNSGPTHIQQAPR